MNKVLFGLGISLLVILAGYAYFSSETEITYVKIVNDEVTELEAELRDVEEAVANGMMTTEVATAAQKKIISRIKSIETATKQSSTANLSQADRARLSEGLARLAQILTTYRDTLMRVDEVVAAKEPQGNNGNSSLQSVVVSVSEEIIATAQDMDIDTDILESVTEELDESDELVDDNVLEAEGGEVDANENVETNVAEEEQLTETSTSETGEETVDNDEAVVSEEVRDNTDETTVNE